MLMRKRGKIGSERNIEDLLLLPQQKIQPLVLLIIWEDMCR